MLLGRYANGKQETAIAWTGALGLPEITAGLSSCRPLQLQASPVATLGRTALHVLAVTPLITSCSIGSFQSPVEFSGTAFAEFQLVTEDFVKTLVQEMPRKSCDLDPIPTSVLYDYLDEIIPIVTSIMNKSLSSRIVPQYFKHALVKLLLKKASLDPNCLKHYRPVSNLPFLSKVLDVTNGKFVPRQSWTF